MSTLAGTTESGQPAVLVFLQTGLTNVRSEGMNRLRGLAGDLELGGDRGLLLTTLGRGYGAVPLLDNGRLHQSQSRPSRPPSTQDGARKADQARCQASAETGVSSIRRNSTHSGAIRLWEDFPYGFKPA